jgi:monoamine oxidase
MESDGRTGTQTALMGRAIWDLVVIGAGVAGLAAARTAREAGLITVVLEAKDRIGGRAWTDTQSLGVPWERGANWLHDAEHNFFTRYADAHGFAYEATAVLVRRLWAGGWAASQLQAARDDYEAQALRAVREAGAAGRDIAAAEVIPPHPRFRASFEPWFAALAGAEPARASTLDFARGALSGSNRRLERGLGALVGHYGRGLPVRLATPAIAIRWDGKDVRVDTPRGGLRARSVIVTLSTNALASGRLRFAPILPAARQEALAGVPTGAANKVALAFTRNVFDRAAPFALRFADERFSGFMFEMRPFGRDLAIGHCGGRWARELEAAGARAMVDLAEEALVQVFGADVRRCRRAAATTAWCSDPDVLGGYSCALPGQAHLRALLAEPLAERVLFAGEACSLEHYGTVHGAWTSGAAAAHEATRQQSQGVGAWRRMAPQPPAC